MNAPIVTLKELAEYLKSLPDDTPIYMGSGLNEGIGCLMTQFGRSKNWEFQRAKVHLDPGWYNLGTKVVSLDANVFSLFHDDDPDDSDIVKGWKNHLKDEYK